MDAWAKVLVSRVARVFVEHADDSSETDLDNDGRDTSLLDFEI